MSEILYVPASIEAFKRTARDIQRAYPCFQLQQSQELLAKAFGYNDLYSLQEHLKGKPRRPDGDEDPMKTWQRMSKVEQKWFELALPTLKARLRPPGWITLTDLQICAEPEDRKQQMDFLASVAAELVGTNGPSCAKLQPDDYVQFFIDDEPMLMVQNHGRKEGRLEPTPRGKAICRALSVVAEMEDGETLQVDGRSLTSVDLVGGIRLRHPNNPYANVHWMKVLCMEEDWHRRPADAHAIWTEAQAARKGFESVMPKGFRGPIEAKLMSSTAENREYIECLHFGAHAALALGHEKRALAWARKSLVHYPQDSWGTRFIVEDITGVAHKPRSWN